MFDLAHNAVVGVVEDGLEIETAAKAGLIDKDQAYFWTKKWQKGERESERDIREGRTYGPFATAEELIESLRS